MLELTAFDTGPCRLFLKLENQNPGGSIKDRIARSMIEAAEADGRLEARRDHRRGDRRQYRPRPGAGGGRQGLQADPGRSRQDGAREDPAPAGHGRRRAADPLRRRQGPSRVLPGLRPARRRRRPARFYVNQFENPANPLAHETTTGPEIFAQMDGDLDAMVVGVGSGRHPDRPRPLFRRAQPRRPGWCWPIRSARSSRRLCRHRHDRRGRAPGSSRASARTSSPTTPIWTSSSKAYSISDRESVETARALLQQGRHPGRLIDRHPAGRRPALLPRADRAQARGDPRLRHRRQIPDQDVQRPVAGRPGLRGPQAAPAACAT